MQNTSKVQQGQSFIDKTLELTGSIESVLTMAVLNNISITDDIAIGNEIIGSDVVVKAIVSELKNNIPATKIVLEVNKTIPMDYGIGEMSIESTFIIR